MAHYHIINMGEGIDHPREERIYQLNELAVPPKRYASFLAKAVSAVGQLIVERHHCSSLDEVAQNYLRRMQRLNPERTVKELLTAPLSVEVQGRLLYDRGHSKRRRAEKIYRSTEYQEYLPVGARTEAYAPGKWVELPSFKDELAAFVEALDTTLNKRFPRREGKVPADLFRRPKSGEATRLEKHIRGFRFVVSMQSFPTAMLEVEIRLRNYGSIGNVKKMHAIPAIHVQARQLYAASLLFPRKIVEAVGEMADKYYTITDVEQRSRFNRGQRS